MTQPCGRRRYFKRAHAQVRRDDLLRREIDFPIVWCQQCKAWHLGDGGREPLFDDADERQLWELKTFSEQTRWRLIDYLRRIRGRGPNPAA